MVAKKNMQEFASQVFHKRHRRMPNGCITWQAKGTARSWWSSTVVLALMTNHGRYYTHDPGISVQESVLTFLTRGID